MRYCLTIINVPPTYLKQVLQEWTHQRGKTILQTRLLILGGEAMSLGLLQLWKESPFCTACLKNAYGPTETTITATTFEVSKYYNYISIPIGYPLSNRNTYLLNPSIQFVGISVFGELHIGGSGLARGYLNRPSLTGEKFIPNLFSSKK